MPNSQAALESAISTLLAKSAARADAMASLRPAPRSRRRSAAQDIRTRLLVTPADVMRRYHDLRAASTFTRSECMVMAWHEARCRTFKNWHWLSEHHQEAAKLTRLLTDRKLATEQQPELRQTGARLTVTEAQRDEINKLKMSLSIIVGHICNTNGE